MAFMMPVMKKEFDIYKGSGRSRKESECSNTSTCRSRKVSETRSECLSLSTSPNAMDYGVQHRNYINRNNSRAFSRTSSRTSQSSLTSPTKNCSPPNPSAGSQGSLNKFHIRLVDKLRKSFGKGRPDTDRSWDQLDDDATAAAATSTADADDPLSVVKHTTVATTTKQLKKLSISSDSSVQLQSPPAYDSSSNDDGLGCSDTNLSNIIISSKPPLPVLMHQRKRSRSIESTAFRSTTTTSSSTANTPTKAKHRHSIAGRLWSRHFSASSSVHDYDTEDASKTKR